MFSFGRSFPEGTGGYWDNHAPTQPRVGIPTGRKKEYLDAHLATARVLFWPQMVGVFQMFQQISRFLARSKLVAEHSFNHVWPCLGIVPKAKSPLYIYK